MCGFIERTIVLDFRHFANSALSSALTGSEPKNAKRKKARKLRVYGLFCWSE